MKVINDLSQWQELRKTLANETIGFVPTMGNLHEGHLSLLERSRAENTLSVLSIFVNPTQFNDSQDYQAYPRTLETDLELAQRAKVDYVLIPTAPALYPDNFTFKIEETLLSLPFEGSFRPGHFSGMLTIVLKLLLLVQPEQAYFGEKDYQQLQLIRRLAQAFFLKTAIIGCPTVREPSGLALSSRNRLLNAEERTLAEQFAALFHQQQESCATIISQLKAKGMGVDYIEEHDGRRFAAVTVGKIRLIDNYALTRGSNHVNPNPEI